MNEEHRLRKLVGSARRRLEVRRFLRAVARGALCGGAVGLALLSLQKLVPALPDDPRMAWTCLLMGALVGFGWAAGRRGIPLAAAALFMDRGLHTKERIVTVITRDSGVFRPRLLRELESVRTLPRLPLPREVGFVPAAAFVLFAASLLPAAGGAPARVAVLISAAGGDGEVSPAAAPDVTRAVARLAQGDLPETRDLDNVRTAIDRRLHTPEERHAAQTALDRALKGDGAAAREVARSLRAAEGGSASSDEEGRVTAVDRGGKEGRAAATAYPEARELLMAYRRALAEEMKR